MSIPDEIASLKRQIARLQAELEALESCMEEDEDNDQYGPDGAAT
jgi:hypothetical protein